MCTLRIRSRSGFRLRGSAACEKGVAGSECCAAGVAGATSVARSPLLHRALGGAAGPVAQAPHVPRLREVQQGEDRQPQEGGQPDVRAYALDEIH